jgi:hypothetical protein
MLHAPARQRFIGDLRAATAEVLAQPSGAASIDVTY